MGGRLWQVVAGLTAVALCGGAVAAHADAPRRAAPVEIHAGNGEENFDPSEVHVEPGEAVYWSFDNPDVAHNVASNSPNWTFATTPQTNHPDTAPYTFTTPGIYAFVCQVHPDKMYGTVIVGDATPTPTPTATATATPTATPTATATATPTPAPTQPPAQLPALAPSPTPVSTATPPARDTVAPRLTGVRAKPITHGVKLELRLSEAATVTATAKHGTKTLKSTTAKLKAGHRTVTLRSSRIKPGRVTVELRARDAAGNRSSLKRSAITVRR
jgi:plastocyanin